MSLCRIRELDFQLFAQSTMLLCNMLSRAQKKNWSIKLRTRGEQRVSAFGLRIQETVPDRHGVARLFMMADPLVGKNSLPCLWAVVYPQTNKLQNSSLVSLKIIQL